MEKYKVFINENRQYIEKWMLITRTDGQVRLIYKPKIKFEPTMEGFLNAGGSWWDTPKLYVGIDYELIERAVEKYAG